MRNVIYFTDNELMAMRECLFEWPMTLDNYDLDNGDGDDKEFFAACNSARKKALKELAYRDDLDLIKRGAK